MGSTVGSRTKIMWAEEAAKLFIASMPEGGRVLDVGGGDDGNGFGPMCREAGLKYQTFDWSLGQDWEVWVNPSLHNFDGLYMSHSLEHMLNVQTSLDRIHRVLRLDGIIAITVPPAKHEIVGGHVSLWNAGLLLYRLVLAGFDCSEAAVKSYGYNVSVVVRRKIITDMPPLKRDCGDIDSLSKYFPFEARQGFHGWIDELNWRPL